MREAYFDSRWVVDQDGRLLGICLGYDHCAEHSGSPSAIQTVFDLAQSQDGEAASCIHFERFKQRSFDPAIRPYPAAIFVAAHHAGNQQKFLARLKAMTKVVDPGQGDPPRSFLMTAWGTDGFAIQARGAEGVDRLEALHKHFVEKRVAVADASHQAQFGRSGLSLVIAERQ